MRKHACSTANVRADGGGDGGVAESAGARADARVHDAQRLQGGHHREAQRALGQLRAACVRKHARKDATARADGGGDCGVKRSAGTCADARLHDARQLQGGAARHSVHMMVPVLYICTCHSLAGHLSCHAVMYLHAMSCQVFACYSFPEPAYTDRRLIRARRRRRPQLNFD